MRSTQGQALGTSRRIVRCCREKEGPEGAAVKGLDKERKLPCNTEATHHSAVSRERASAASSYFPSLMIRSSTQCRRLKRDERKGNATIFQRTTCRCRTKPPRPQPMYSPQLQSGVDLFGSEPLVREPFVVVVGHLVEPFVLRWDQSTCSTSIEHYLSTVACCHDQLKFYEYRIESRIPSYVGENRRKPRRLLRRDHLWTSGTIRPVRLFFERGMDVKRPTY